MSYDRLIFGKNEVERVCSIEVSKTDGTLTLFREDADPVVLRNRFWILAPDKINKDFVRLKGELYYKWGWQCTNYEDYGKRRFWWKENDVFSIFDPKEAACVKDGITYFKGMKHTDVSVLSFDIESLSLEHTDEADVIIISNTFRRNGIITRKMFCYDEYATRKEMLDAWCAWVRECNPSVVIGHNIYGYDLPYLHFIAKRHGTTLNLGRDGSAIEFNARTSRFRKDQTQFIEYFRPHIYGREIVDTMFLSIKHDAGPKNYESYALKKIIEQECLEVAGRQHYDASQIRYKYKNPGEWEKIKMYALHDADDSLALYDLMIPAYFYATQMIPKSFQSMIESATGSQINSLLCRSYLQDAHSLPKTNEKRKYEGAISFGVPGIYRNVLKVDIKSEYPSAIRQYEIYDRNKDPDGNLLKIVNILTEQRFEFKKLAKETGDRNHINRDSSAKLMLNSIYGTLGAPGLNFNSMDCAEMVTAAGREVIKFSIEWATSNSYDPIFYGVNNDEEKNSGSEATESDL